MTSMLREKRNETRRNELVNATAAASHHGWSSPAEDRIGSAIKGSPMMAAQRQRLQGIFGTTAMGAHNPAGSFVDALATGTLQGKKEDGAAGAPIHANPGVVQRVTEADVPAILHSLPLEYQVHFQKEVAQFQDEKLKEVRNETLRNVWQALENSAFKAGRVASPKKSKSVVLAEWDTDKARATVIANAQSILEAARSDREALREYGFKPFAKGGKVIPFEAPPFGRGSLEVIFNKNDVVMFAAHGFTHSTGVSTLFTDAEKAYGFMSGKYESVSRSGVTKEQYFEMAKKLSAEVNDYKIAGVPDLVVFPHYGKDAISGEGEFLGELAEKMDVAILRDWEWHQGPEGRMMETAFVNTVPLTFILGSQPLKQYGKYLMQVCRADWSRTAGVSGGSARVAPKLMQW